MYQTRPPRKATAHELTNVTNNGRKTGVSGRNFPSPTAVFHPFLIFTPPFVRLYKAVGGFFVHLRSDSAVSKRGDWLYYRGAVNREP
ncbi:MAG: hypothetical protein IAE79_02150 [Anaerolinea sp.]|nr:hypothetical protein [Anaerolinea sp.]